MRTIINGKTFDTRTCKPLAVSESLGDSGDKLLETLYINRCGAFFEVSNVHYGMKKMIRFAGSKYIRALSVQEAKGWAERNNARILEDYAYYLGELPPEEGEKVTAITVRMNRALKIKSERAARKEGISLNQYIVNKLE